MVQLENMTVNYVAIIALAATAGRAACSRAYKWCPCACPSKHKLGEFDTTNEIQGGGGSSMLLLSDRAEMAGG